MAKQRKLRVSTASRVADAERQVTSMALPAPVHWRLDEIVRLAGDVRPTRAEVVAMLISQAELDSAELEQRILRYRKTTVGELVGTTDEDVVVPIHGPGRRKSDPAV
jgi:hypothetical protein